MGAASIASMPRSATSPATTASGRGSAGRIGRRPRARSSASSAICARASGSRSPVVSHRTVSLPTGRPPTPRSPAGCARWRTRACTQRPARSLPSGSRSSGPACSRSPRLMPARSSASPTAVPRRRRGRPPACSIRCRCTTRSPERRRERSAARAHRRAVHRTAADRACRSLRAGRAGRGGAPGLLQRLSRGGLAFRARGPAHARPRDVCADRRLPGGEDPRPVRLRLRHRRAAPADRRARQSRLRRARRERRLPRPVRRRQDASGDRARLSRHAAWLEGALHHRRRPRAPPRDGAAAGALEGGAASGGQRLPAADCRRDRLSADGTRAGEPVLPGRRQAVRARRADDPDLEPDLRRLGPGLCRRCRADSRHARPAAPSFDRDSDQRRELPAEGQAACRHPRQTEGEVLNGAPPGVGRAPPRAKRGWVRFQSATPRKAGQIPAGVDKGKSGGGLCYGYDVVKHTDAEGEPIRGERTINEAQAEIVRRVFRAFAAGISPRAIARRLNEEGIPGPDGALWTDSTVRGHAARGTGLINNELYIGKLVWNRLRYIKDPATGRRVSRLNRRDKWITTEVPELRIVDDELWQAAKTRQGELAEKYANVIAATRAAHTNRLNGTHRPRSLLSGLLVCGCCSGPYALRGQDRYACSNHVMNGSCSNSRSIARAALEARMLEGLRARLMAPEIAAEAMRAYAEETNQLNRERRAGTEAERHELDKITRSIKEIVALVEDGSGSRALSARLRELEAREDDLTERLSRAPVDIPDIHPNVAGIYRRKVERLAEALQHPQERDEAADAIRALIDRITLTPGAKRGEIVGTLHGDLGTILEWVAQKQNTPGLGGSGVSVSVVAGTGFEPVTFRL